MIVICPNCGAQYRLPDTVSVVGKRMRCADCEHRWTIEAPPVVDEPRAPEPVDAQPEMALPEAPVPPPADEPEVGSAETLSPDTADELPLDAAPNTAVDAEDTDEEEEPEGRGLRWLWWVAGLVILLVGGVMALVALERLDPARVPLAGDLLARLQPGPSPLVIEAQARLTPVPGGALVLEVTGQLRNSGQAAVNVGALKATLGGAAVGGGVSVARRWSIALPTTRLEAGASVLFSSTLTDVPGGATQLRITTG